MYWIHLSDTVPRARKEYHCDICATRIERGEVHVARRGILEEHLVTMRMHLECEELSSNWTEDEWECHLPGDVKRPASNSLVEDEFDKSIRASVPELKSRYEVVAEEKVG